MLNNPDVLNHRGTLEGTTFIEKKFAVLQEITSAMVATTDTNALSYLMLDFVINYTGAEKGSIMLLNERSELYILASRGVNDDLIRNYRVKIGEGIAGSVAQSQKPVLVEDIDHNETFRNLKRERYRTRSFISCPMISRNKFLGVLNIHDKRNGTPFSKNDLDLATVIANQAAILLENASLMNQLRINAVELEKINRKMMEADVVKTEFFTQLSHELRTPLNSVKGSAYYLLQSEPQSGSKRREFYEIISKETDSLISTVENLLTFLRSEDESRIIKKSLLNLAEILKNIESSKSLRHILDSKGLNMEVHIPDNLPDIAGDRVWANQFFLHLIEGLSLHLEKNDAIAISVKDNEYVELKLSLPRRMPDSVLPYLFDSLHLFRQDRPKEETKLYLAWKIADMHRWNLNAMNTDEGFALQISMPKSTLQIVDIAISDAMEFFIEFISEVMDVNTCYIMLIDELTGDLNIRSVKGLESGTIKSMKLGFDERIAGLVAVRGEALLIEDTQRPSILSGEDIPSHDYRPMLSVPLKINEKVIGVVNFSNKRSTQSFTQRDLVLATVITQRISRFIERVRGMEYSGESLTKFLSCFNTLLEAERKYHKRKGKIPGLMKAVMDTLGMSESEKEIALYVAAVYDLGLMLVDENILNKKTLLPFEARVLRAHPHLTVDLLKVFEFSDEAKKYVLHHHERYDGRGYPDGLSGEDIPLVSRVLSVVDAFCAMTSERSYGNKLTYEEAMDEIRRGSGSIFDPRVVSALENVF